LIESVYREQQVIYI